MADEWRRDDYLLTTDPAAVDVGAVHAFLHDSYWARGVPLDVVKRSLEHSLSFTLLRDQHLVGFARVITDYATFAYVTDVFVLPEFRGQGLATWMMTCILTHPELQGFRRWCLATRDAHHVYARVGFARTAIPERWMEMLDPHVYDRDTPQQ
jgi:GNAT superfamily N-acetyltransferase